MRIAIERRKETTPEGAPRPQGVGRSPYPGAAGAAAPEGGGATAADANSSAREKLAQAFGPLPTVGRARAGRASAEGSPARQSETAAGGGDRSVDEASWPAQPGGPWTPLEKIRQAFGRRDGGGAVVQRQDAASAGSRASPPADVAPRAVKVGGDPTSRKIIRVAWTMDDGPTVVTGEMKKTLGGIPATWFVMRSQIESGGHPESKLAELKAVQDGGGEIGIHGLHKTESHLAWFPSDRLDSYASIDEALADLETFKKQLDGAGINAKFVRLPYGEFTEIVDLLAKLGMSEKEDKPVREDTARKIIRGEEPSFEPKPGKAERGAKKQGAGPPGRAAGAKGAAETKAAEAKAVETKEAAEAKAAEAKRARFLAIAKAAKKDWGAFLAKCASLGLHNWMGARNVQSWQAESSGTGLTDDVTSSHGGVVKDAKKDERGKFEARVDRLKEGEPGSLVILAHDVAPKGGGRANLVEVGADVARMESYAKSKKVRIEYYTLSELYELTHGKEP